MGTAENYKHLYEQMKKIVAMYQDEIVPGMRREIEDLEKNQIKVRCKDCKHYDNSEGICWCKLNSKFFPGGLDWHGFPEDGFCSFGERKDNV